MNHDCKEWGPTVLRIVAGIVFVAAGINKFMNLDMTMGMFDGLGIPLAGAAVWLVAIVELVGGIMLLAGWNVKYAAVPLAVIGVVAAITMFIANSGESLWMGFMMSWSGLFAATMMASLYLTGPGMCVFTGKKLEA